MKIPRDLSAEELVNALTKIGYTITRQRGSHIRLTSISNSEEHNITVPNHNPIKIGTLNKILTDISSRLGINKQELLEKLFHK